MPSPIRIIMADDHEIFREGFAAMFHNNPGIELIAEAVNGAYLVSLVSTHKPDVVLTDIQMDVMDGIEATRIISKRFPETAVIAMSMYDDNYSILEMLKAGAIGYLVKNATKQVVMEAIRAAYAGENYYCRTASQRLSALITAGRYDPKNQVSLDFTPTELRIIRMICMDMDSRQIAAELLVSLYTVKTYRREIMEKAGVKSTSGLIMFAVRNGMVKP